MSLTPAPLPNSAPCPRLDSPSGPSHFHQLYRHSLLQGTLPFWFPRAIDTECGGYLHYFDHDGSLFDTDKSIWAQGRMSWMLLTLYNQCQPQAEWLEWGLHGLRFLEQHAFDQDGRMFFQVTRQGRPLRKRRYAYSECFAAIAFAAAARATGSEAWSTRARTLFQLFTQCNFEPGAMLPKYTSERPMIALGPRIMTIVTAQELRTDLGPDPLWNAWIDRCIEEIERHFVNAEQQVVLENVAEDGSIVDHVDGRTLNPGHAIEGAWFILREGWLRHEPRWISLGCQMLDWMWKRGWDEEFGGLFYFRDLHDRPCQEYWHDMKFWWPHDETIIATLLAYLLTGQPHYATWHHAVHIWSHQHFADPKHGEWFGYLHRDGRRSTTTKGNLWKSCFHHPRMQWLASHFLDPASSIIPSPPLPTEPTQRF